MAEAVRTKERYRKQSKEKRSKLRGTNRLTDIENAGQPSEVNDEDQLPSLFMEDIDQKVTEISVPDVDGIGHLPEVSQEPPLATAHVLDSVEKDETISPVGDINSDEVSEELKTIVIRADLPYESTSIEQEIVDGTLETTADEKSVPELLEDFTRSIASVMSIARNIGQNESVIDSEEAPPPPYCENVVVASSRPLLYTDLRQALHDLHDFESATTSSVAAETNPTAPPMFEEEADSPLEKCPMEEAEQVSAQPRLPQIVHRKIHATRTVNQLEDLVVRPFTEAQLKALYRNAELEANEQFVADFIAKNLFPESHEFQELVAGYLRSRVALVACTKSLEDMRRDYKYRVDRVWETVEQVAQKHGQCLDKAVVFGQHKYVKAVYNKTQSAKLHKLLKNIQTTLHENYALHAYELEMSRLQIESYLHRLRNSIPELKDIPRNAPILVYVEGCRPSQLSVHIEEVKRCVAILFSVQRKPLNDVQSLQDTRNWLTSLVSVLLRLGTFDDHLFLLNHVLRCPAGIGAWAIAYIQVPLPLAIQGDYSIHGPHLDHILTVLATILLPVRAREQFLKHLKVETSTTSVEAVEEQPWVMVDSEGEEDEDPLNCWLHWRENDLVALLNQIPIGTVFRCLLRIHSRDDVDHYDVRSMTDADVIHVFAFATHLIHLWREGLKTFHLARYRQFTKRISQLIRHTVLYVSNHWEQFLLVNLELPMYTGHRLQSEYDQFFFRAAYSIFSSQSLGAWQFMAAMPYNCVSVEMIWKILWLLHNDYREQLDAVESEILAGDWKKKLDDEHLRLTFEEKLSSMPQSEAFYLLTAFANMACSRKSEEREMIETICQEVFQISFLNESTKELCSKWGRELLFTISVQHPFVVSEILEEVRINMTKLGKISIYLFCELPVHLWEPSNVDVDTIVLWLIEYAPSSPENQLAQIILSSMNWDFNSQADDLFLDISLHRRIALAVVQSFRKHLPTTNGGFVSERLKQVTNLAAAALKKDNDPEDAFSSWAWEMIMSLRLHIHQQPPVRLLNCNVDVTVPDLNNAQLLGEILWCFRQKHPLAILVAFTMTNIGHNVTCFCEKLDYLATLVELQHYEAALHVLCLATPFFFKCGHYLWTSKRFITLIQNILSSDCTYVKMAKSFVSVQFPGNILQCFAGLIEYQVEISGNVGWDLKSLFQFWTELLTSHPLWYKNQSVLYLLDIIFQASFMEGISDSKEVLAKRFLNESSSQGSGGGFTSFVSWLATGSGVPFTFVPKNMGSKFVYLSYYALEMETESEHQIKLWRNTLRQLAAVSSLSPEAALKKAASNSEDLVPPPVHHLAIYRWAELVLEIPLSHPLLPLLWQKFFTLFLQRVPQTARSGSLDCGSVGERFFANTADVPLFKKLKRRLDEMTNHFVSTSKYPSQNNALPESEVAEGYSDELETQYRNVVLNDKLTRIYRTFYLWLEEPRLHDPSPYLPSFPAEYEPSRLLVLFQNSRDPWSEFVNMDEIQSHRRSLVGIWGGRSLQKYRRPGWKVCSNRASVSTNDAGVEAMLKRLQSYEAPLSAPCIAPLKTVVPELAENAFSSRRTLLEITRPHLTTLKNYASLFSDRVAKHLSLDCNYMELLPQLWRNVDTEVRLKVRCSRRDLDDKRCLGPAVIVLIFKEKKLIISVEHNLEHNRADWLMLLEESIIGPPTVICSAAVFVENTVSVRTTHLSWDVSACIFKVLFEAVTRPTYNRGKSEIISCPAATFKKGGNDVDSNTAQMRDVGVNLFYHVCGLLDGDTELYPPTRQFLTSCVDILGQKLVQTKGDQCDHILQLICSGPRLVGVLAPHFCPNMADADDFLQLYRRVISVHRENGTDVAFVVLSKFDVKRWLDVKKPRLESREIIVDAIGTVLEDLGPEPPPELAGISELYRHHLVAVLLHQFPDMYRDIFAFLFKGTDSGSISIDVWYDILNALVNNVVAECKDRLSTDSNVDEISSICCKFAQTQELFSFQQIRETLGHLGDTYMKSRVSSKKMILQTLYNTYASYAKPIVIFCGLMSHAYVACLKRESTTSVGALSVAELRDTWRALQSCFSPWTLPVDNRGKLWLPWVADQEFLASVAVSLFGSCVQYANSTLYASGSMLSLFLEMYSSELARPCVEDHVLVVWHNIFSGLPWTTFWPDPCSVELMITILNSGRAECSIFLGDIFVQIGWPQVVHHVVQHESRSTVSRTMENLLQLYVCLGLQLNANREKGDGMAKLLASAHGHQWEFIDSSSYESAMRRFLSECNPQCVFVDEGVKDSCILSLLQTAAEFVPGTSPVNSQAPTKRVTFVRACVHLLCECASKNKTLIRTRMELFKDVILSLMKHTEAVLVTGPNQEKIFETAVTLVTEILNVLNVASVACLQDLTIKALQDWAKAYPRSPIFGAVLHATSRSLASVSHMAVLLESLVESYFSIDLDLCIAGNGWSFLLSVIEIPQLTQEDLVAECLNCGHFLTLKTLAGLLLINCKSVEEQCAVLSQVIGWLEQAKPTHENEHKLILLWWIFLECIIRIRSSLTFSDVSKLLTSFASAIQPLGEDKSPLGFWAAFGLGKKSPLSQRFRFVARSVNAFVLVRANSLELDVDANPTLARQSQSALSLLESTKTNRQYGEYREYVDRVLDYVQGESHSLRDGTSLLSYLSRLMYPDKRCLSVIFC